MTQKGVVVPLKSWCNSREKAAENAGWLVRRFLRHVCCKHCIIARRLTGAPPGAPTRMGMGLPVDAWPDGRGPRKDRTERKLIGMSKVDTAVMPVDYRFLTLMFRPGPGADCGTKYYNDKERFFRVN